VTDCSGPTDKAYLLFRDMERKSCVSIGICENLQRNRWRFEDLTDFSVGMWEPSYDTELWNREKILHVFIQNTGQGDGETMVDIPPQDIAILEWKPQ
jgi:hypothetical protein